jgi:hypothetical protein
MKELEKYFIITSFEDGWGINEYAYEELLYDYCTEVLFIPYEKIEEVSIVSDGLEIQLFDLKFDDIQEDWYSNLVKLNKDGIITKFIA